MKRVSWYVLSLASPAWSHCSTIRLVLKRAWPAPELLSYGAREEKRYDTVHHARLKVEAITLSTIVVMFQDGSIKDYNIPCALGTFLIYWAGFGAYAL